MNFQDTLGRLNRGRFFLDLEDSLADVLQGVQATRKKGTVTVTLTIGMEGQEEDQVNIAPKIVAKRPMRDTAPTTLFIDDEGNLDVADPKQRDFGDLLEVNQETGEVLEPDASQAAG